MISRCITSGAIATRISSNLSLALVAAEDRTVPTHQFRSGSDRQAAAANNDKGRKVRAAAATVSADREEPVSVERAQLDPGTGSLVPC